MSSSVPTALSEARFRRWEWVFERVMSNYPQTTIITVPVGINQHTLCNQLRFSAKAYAAAAWPTAKFSHSQFVQVLDQIVFSAPMECPGQVRIGPRGLDMPVSQKDSEKLGVVVPRHIPLSCIHALLLLHHRKILTSPTHLVLYPKDTTLEDFYPDTPTPSYDVTITPHPEQGILLF